MGGYSFEDLEVYKPAGAYRKKTYSLARQLPVIYKRYCRRSRQISFSGQHQICANIQLTNRPIHELIIPIYTAIHVFHRPS